MSIRRWAARVAMVVTVGSTALLGIGSAAQAGGSIGDCHPVHAGNWGGGWCEGTGPDWTYRAAVKCNDGGPWYIGSAYHWAGDQRSLYKNCPSGYSSVRGGLAVYYLGSIQWIAAD